MRGALGLTLFVGGAVMAWLVVLDKFPIITGGSGPQQLPTKQASSPEKGTLI